MVDGRPNIQFHDEAVVDPSGNKGRQVQLEQHPEEYREEQRRVNQEDRLDLGKVTAGLISQGCKCRVGQHSVKSSRHIGNVPSISPKIMMGTPIPIYVPEEKVLRWCCRIKSTSAHARIYRQ